MCMPVAGKRMAGLDTVRPMSLILDIPRQHAAGSLLRRFGNHWFPRYTRAKLLDTSWALPRGSSFRTKSLKSEFRVLKNGVYLEQSRGCPAFDKLF